MQALNKQSVWALSIVLKIETDF